MRRVPEPEGSLRYNAAQPQIVNESSAGGSARAVSANLKKLRPYDEAPRSRPSLIPGTPDSAATLWLVVGALWLVAATGIGALWLAQAIVPQATLTMHAALPLNLNVWLVIAPDRNLAAFQNALVYGWLSNAAIGAIWFVTPRVTGRPLVSNAGANAALGLWNLAVLIGIASIYLGILPDTGMLSEFLLPIDALAVLALLMVNGIFWGSAVPALGRDTYISVLYFGVGLLAFLGLYTLNAAAPLLNLADPLPALINGFYVRTLEAYWLLGAAVGTLYYLIPRATGNPLYSAGLALLGWVTWLGLSALSGLGALLDPHVPYAITTLGSVGTMLLVLPAFLVAANLLLTISGRWSLLLGAGSLAFAIIALAFLVMTAILEGIGSLRSVGAYTAGTVWPIGAFIYAGLGAYTFAFIALAEHAFPRLLRRAWNAGPLSDAARWLGFSGVALAGASLMLGGLAQGSLLSQNASADVVNGTLVWFRLVGLAGLGLATLGAIAFLGNLFLMYTAGRPAEYAVATPPPAASPSAAGN